MSSILVIVGLVIVAFFVALFNNKARLKNTTADIRIVHGSKRKYNEKTNTWPEEVGEIVTLHLNEDFLDGKAHVISIKENTIAFSTEKPFLYNGEEKTHFVLSRDALTTLVPIGEEDETPYHLSFAFTIPPITDDKESALENAKQKAENDAADEKAAADVLAEQPADEKAAALQTAHAENAESTEETANMSKSAAGND